MKLSFAFRFTEVALGDLDAIDVDNGRRWARVKLRHAAGREAVSGLSREGRGGACRCAGNSKVRLVVSCPGVDLLYLRSIGQSFDMSEFSQ